MGATATRNDGVVGRYRDEHGTLHRVLVRPAGGAWEIVDRAWRQEPVLVDRLAGPEENRLSAEAVAVDWIGQRAQAQRGAAEQ